MPPEDGVTAPWWDATRERRLLIQFCDACERPQYPPRALCSHCGATSTLAWRESTGEAVVDSFTVVHRAPRPDVDVPYVIAYIRLREGAVMLSRLEKRARRVVDW